MRNNFRGVFFNNTTFHKDIYFLNPGTNLIINKNLIIKKKRYWVKSKYNPTIKDFKFASKKLNVKVKNEFQKSFRSDTKVAFLLSGGIDSSVILSISKNMKIKKILLN